jgi:hypothetical protein
MPVVSKLSNKPAPTPTPDSPPSAWDLPAGLRLALYGKSGTGKTRFWATMPGPILALVCSGGKKPGELKSIDTPEYRKKIDPRIINSTEDLKKMIAKAPEYKTVVLDNVSGLLDLCVKEMLKLDEIPLTKAKIGVGKGESWSLVSRQQYGQLNIELKTYLRDLFNGSENVVIIGHERVFSSHDDETTSESDVMQPTVGISITPQVAKWVEGACDYVAQMFIRPKTRLEKSVTEINGVKEVTETKVREKGVEYCLRCEPHDVYSTKFRTPAGSGSLPDVIVDPSYTKLLAVIQGRTSHVQASCSQKPGGEG